MEPSLIKVGKNHLNNLLGLINVGTIYVSIWHIYVSYNHHFWASNQPHDQNRIAFAIRGSPLANIPMKVESSKRTPFPRHVIILLLCTKHGSSSVLSRGITDWQVNINSWSYAHPLLIVPSKKSLSWSTHKGKSYLSENQYQYHWLKRIWNHELRVPYPSQRDDCCGRLSCRSIRTHEWDYHQTENHHQPFWLVGLCWININCLVREYTETYSSVFVVVLSKRMAPVGAAFGQCYERVHLVFAPWGFAYFATGTYSFSGWLKKEKITDLFIWENKLNTGTKTATEKDADKCSKTGAEYIQQRKTNLESTG